MNKTIHIIGGPDHGKTFAIKAGTSLLLSLGGPLGPTTQVGIQEVVVNSCIFYIAKHPEATPAQVNEVMAVLQHLTRFARPWGDSQVTCTHPGLRDEFTYPDNGEELLQVASKRLKPRPPT